MLLENEESRVYSQQGQDGVLAEIFRRLGVTNRFYVEFGFDADDFGGGSGPNTRNLWEQGWRGLLLDGSHANASINLHRHYIQPDNIAALFKKYEVPKEADYVSIDLDSCDIWVLLELAKEYRPRVVSVEYNSNFPAGSAISMPPDCSQGWHGDRLMGASLGAVYAAAADAGYVVVHALPETDAFLVRADLAACLEVLPQWAHEARLVGRPLHPPVRDPQRLAVLVDYAAYRRSGGNLAYAREQAAAALPYMTLLTEGGRRRRRRRRGR